MYFFSNIAYFINWLFDFKNDDTKRGYSPIEKEKEIKKDEQIKIKEDNIECLTQSKKSLKQTK